MTFSASSREPRTLEVRVDPFGSTLMTVVISLGFFGFGVFLTVGLVSSLLGQTQAREPWGTGHTMGSLMALAALVVGGGLLRLTVNSIRTKVRLSLEEADVRVEWVRGEHAVRGETIPRTDLVDVYVDKEVASGDGYVYSLALGRKDGYLRLSMVQSGYGLKFYREQCQAIATFLELPARMD